MKEELNAFLNEYNKIYDMKVKGFIELLSLSKAKIEDNRTDLEQEKENDPRSFRGRETDIYNFKFEYPRAIMSSIFILAYSFFEFRLKMICLKAEYLLNTKLKHNDLNGSHIDKFLKFLEIEFDLNRSLLDMEKLGFYRYVRNKLSHQGGIIDYTNDQLNEHDQYVKLINKNPHLAINTKTKQILITDNKFVEEFVGFSAEFHKKIVHEIS